MERHQGGSISTGLERKVVEQYRAGIGGYTIAAKTGISPCVIYRILKRNSVSTHRDFSRVGKDHRLFDDETEKKIGEEYISGASLNALAKKHKANLVTIRNVLIRLGIKRRWRGNSFKKLEGREKKKIVASRKAGKSRDLVAKQLGISRQLVELVERGKQPKEERSKENCGGSRVRWQGGYISVSVPRQSPYYSMVNAGGYVFEHRLVMARYLGRPLREDEFVHHINGEKTDNRIENLQLLHVGHPKGAAFCCGDCGSINVLPVPLKTKKELN